MPLTQVEVKSVEIGQFWIVDAGQEVGGDGVGQEHSCRHGSAVQALQQIQKKVVNRSKQDNEARNTAAATGALYTRLCNKYTNKLLL